MPGSGTPNKLSCLAGKFFVLCTVHIHTHTHTHTDVFVIHKCQRVILEELTVTTNYDACVSESLNKNEHGEVLCLDDASSEVGGRGRVGPSRNAQVDRSMRGQVPQLCPCWPAHWLTHLPPQNASMWGAQGGGSLRRPGVSRQPYPAHARDPLVGQ